MVNCKICGSENCKKHTVLIGKIQELKEFSGSSPPEIFIGKWNYPNVYIGILSPKNYGNNEILSSPEIWHKNKLNIPEIISLRNQLIYGRTTGNVKKIKLENKIIKTMQEVAMSSKSIATEFKLEKSIINNFEKENSVPLIKNAANLKSAKLEENPKVENKVDYLVSDKHIKSKDAILELDKYKISTTTIIKILSAGLLGIEKNRKLVPTRWSITATDDILSKTKIRKIKEYSLISDILIFNSEYLGNHYEFLLLPEEFGFEVIEISLKNFGVWQDYETNFGRKNYASNVTGAYYANRLALTEYLEKNKKQAKCIVFRQISEEYTAPLGVGILRQISREAFSKDYEKFTSLSLALERIQERLRINIKEYTEKSFLLKGYNKQKRLEAFN